MRTMTAAELQREAEGRAMQQSQARRADPVPQTFYEVCTPNNLGGETVHCVTLFWHEAEEKATELSRDVRARIYSFRQSGGHYVRRLEAEIWDDESVTARWRDR